MSMMENQEDLELNERLKLIESMIAEGRRTTEKWAWTFVLWGVAYYIAIAWSAWGRAALAWPVTMIATGVLTGVLAGRVRSNRPGTTVGRAIGSVWFAMGISMFVLLMSLSLSGRYDLHIFVAIVSAMLGMANAVSSMILRWKMQFACAVVWLATAVAACFTTDNQVSVIFLAAIFFCQIVFGIYGMIAESRRHGRSAANA
jgi:hypothetical protein